MASNTIFHQYFLQFQSKVSICGFLSWSYNLPLHCIRGSIIGVSFLPEWIWIYGAMKKPCFWCIFSLATKIMWKAVDSNRFLWLCGDPFLISVVEMLELCQGFLSESSIVKSEPVHLTRPFLQEVFNALPLGSTTHSAHCKYWMSSLLFCEPRCQHPSENMFSVRQLSHCILTSYAFL